MTDQFGFGFPGDDIGVGQDAGKGRNTPKQTNTSSAKDSTMPALAEPQVHTVDELLAQLPPNLSYNFLIETTETGKRIRIPRREIFDIRLQLAAEDGSPEDSSKRDPLMAGLGNNDIQRNVYEGGLKSWEGSVDLVKFLANNPGLWTGEGMKVMELGCGTALPTLYLFKESLLKSSYLPSQNTPADFTLADYNWDVIRLATFPNLFLAWAMVKAFIGYKNEDIGNLETTPLLEMFKATLQTQKINLSFLSGAWGPQLSALVPVKPNLVLASETIYSLDSLPAFARTLVELLRGGEGGENSTQRTALVAAKLVYFGVGGGVDEFLGQLKVEDKDRVVGKVKYVFDTMKELKSKGGVSRVILQLTGRQVSGT